MKVEIKYHTFCGEMKFDAIFLDGVEVTNVIDVKVDTSIHHSTEVTVKFNPDEIIYRQKRKSSSLDEKTVEKMRELADAVERGTIHIKKFEYGLDNNFELSMDVDCYEED